MLFTSCQMLRKTNQMWPTGRQTPPVNAHELSAETELRLVFQDQRLFGPPSSIQSPSCPPMPPSSSHSLTFVTSLLRPLNPQAPHCPPIPGIWAWGHLLFQPCLFSRMRVSVLLAIPRTCLLAFTSAQYLPSTWKLPCSQAPRRHVQIHVF